MWIMQVLTRLMLGLGIFMLGVLFGACLGAMSAYEAGGDGPAEVME